MLRRIMLVKIWYEKNHRAVHLRVFIAGHTVAMVTYAAGNWLEPR